MLADVGVEPDRFCMIGNSVRSDVIPVLRIGGQAIHVPYQYTWDHELAEHDGDVVSVDALAGVPELVRSW